MLCKRVDAFNEAGRESISDAVERLARKLQSSGDVGVIAALFPTKCHDAKLHLCMRVWHSPVAADRATAYAEPRGPFIGALARMTISKAKP